MRAVDGERVTAADEPLAWSEVPGPEAMLDRVAAFRDALATRRTVRDFAPDPVPRAVIEAAIATAARAPSGANQQPWHFAALGPGPLRARLRAAAEAEERAFYAARASPEWLDALAPLGTSWAKPFLETAPWLIAIFAERWGEDDRGSKVKHYYVMESVGIATGFLLAALHAAGLATLTHTPAPMGFLNAICARPEREKPFVLVVTGHPAPGCRVPIAGGVRKPAAAVTSWL
jgi:nitroreductase